MPLSMLLPLWLAAAGGSQGVVVPADWERLRAGEAIVEAAQTERSGGAVKVMLLMQAEPEALWGVLLSCERTFEFVDGLRECESVDGGLSHERVRQRVKKNLLLPALDYVIEFDRSPYERIEFQQVEGDLELLEGEWRFDPMPGGAGLLVTHELRVRPSFPVPRWLVRRSLARDVPDLLLCLRALAGGSPDAAWAAADRAACPAGDAR